MLPRPATAEPLRFLPVMLVLFVGSGCAALVYEIVWFQVLQLVIGSSAVSLAVLLGTFMGGMCAGSLLLARYVSRARHPLAVYAMLEVLIGACGLGLIVLMPLVSRVYTAVDGGGPSSVVLRAVISALLLLPPTVLMGATLPAMSRYVQVTLRGTSWLGLFYGGNIAGAVLGCLGAGFFLLRKFDLTTASLVGVALNLAVAALAWALSRRAPYAPGVESSPGVGSEKATSAPPGRWLPRGVYLAIALSGLTALGAEVVWTRLLSLMFGATTYAFSIILAVFLAGLGIGSVIGSWLGRDLENPRAALGWTQLLLGLSTAWGAFMIARALPWWPLNERLAPSPWLVFQVDLARALFAILPGALLWGASFPLALAAVSAESPRTDPGRTVGRVYGANTLGAIAGSLITGLVLVPWIGTKGAQQAFIVVSVVSGLVVLFPMMRRPGGPSLGTLAAAGVLAIAALYCARTVSPVPTGLIAWGRSLSWQGTPNALYWGEGLNSSIAVTEEANGWRNFHVSGKVEASTEPQDMRLQRLLGHLSALMHEKPKDVLVVGFGAGVTAGAISIHPTVERMVICELEPLIPRIVSTYFHDANHGVAENPRVSIVYDDARHYVLTTRDKFDVITSDPIHPWVKGAAALYTREYFEHVKAHLKPGGVVTQWVPLYESTVDVVRSEMATFFAVFPNGTAWRNDNTDGNGYDMVLVGRLDDTPIDVTAWQAKLMQPEYQPVQASLDEVGLGNAYAVLETYMGRGPELAEWLRGAEINRDRNLRLQYLAGMGYNEFRGTEIREAILKYRTFPADLFAGTPESVGLLQAVIMKK